MLQKGFSNNIVGTFIRASTVRSVPTKCNQITMVDEDNRLKSNKTWIKWTKLDNGLLLKYHEKWYKKPGDEEELRKKIRQVMIWNNNAKQRRLKVAEPKRSQIKYADGIDIVKRMKKWKAWESLESGSNKTLNIMEKNIERTYQMMKKS
jgi:hypothetical protein